MTLFLRPVPAAVLCLWLFVVVVNMPPTISVPIVLLFDLLLRRFSGVVSLSTRRVLHAVQA